jgi:hypothetical protein
MKTLKCNYRLTVAVAMARSVVSLSWYNVTIATLLEWLHRCYSLLPPAAAAWCRRCCTPVLPLYFHNWWFVVPF